MTSDGVPDPGMLVEAVCSGRVSRDHDIAM